MPAVLLSGFMFPRERMPLPVYAISCAAPVTYHIEIPRGMILRGAEAIDLWRPAAMLALFAAVIFTSSTPRLRKRLE